MGLRDRPVLSELDHRGRHVTNLPNAMRTAARLEAMITDPVHEGKSMAGLIDLVSRGEIYFSVPGAG